MQSGNIPLTNLMNNIQPKLFVNETIMEKIQYLCMRIHEVEWSGVLLYSLKGSIKKPENLEFHVEDIIPMDKGTSATTEYQYNKKSLTVPDSFDDKHIDYIESKVDDNPNVLTWKIGHIHSHQNMGVFFSEVDMKELEDNCVAHNFYLSLVVNNKMDMVAKVIINAGIKQTITASYKALDENGEEYNIDTVDLEVTKNKFISYDCQIIKSEQTTRVDKTFISSVDSIIEEASKKSIYSNYNSFNNYNGYMPQTPAQNLGRGLSSLFPKEENWYSGTSSVPKNKDNKPFVQKPFIPISQIGNNFNSFNNELPILDNKFKERVEEFVNEIDFNNIEISPMEKFVVYLLNNGEIEDGTTIEEFLEMVEEEVIQGTWKYDTKDFLLKYPDYYNEYFGVDGDDENMFIDTLDCVVDLLADAAPIYDFIKPLQLALEQLLTRFTTIEK